MKKTIFFAGAMMLLASVACNKEAQTDNQPSVELKPQVTLSFNAALTTPTKTEIGNSETADGVTVHEIYWSKDDKIAVYPHDPDSNAGVNGVEFTSEDLAETSAAEAVFTGEIDAADAYYAFYPTTAGAKWNGGTYSDFSVTLPYEQTANGIASGFAVANVTGTEKVTFDHVCGFVKFTIDETYAGKIKEVRFSGKNSEALAGKLFVYPDDMSRNKINGSQQTVLTLSPSAGDTFAVGTYYFTCFPVNLTGGLELTFVNTDDEEAVKSSATEANIERAGVLNLGTVANLEFESVTPPIANGTYVILAKKDDVYYAMGSDKYGTSSRLNEVEFDINATTIYDNSLVWSFENTSGVNYRVTNHEGKYLSATSSNTASVKDTETSMVVSENEDGTYLITTVYNEQTRYLSRNDSNNGFAFYGNTDQNGNLYLKAITYVELPKLVAPEIVVTGDDASKSITVTWTDVDNATSYDVVCGEMTQTVGPEVGTCTLTMDDYGTYDVTVTAKANGYVSATSEVVTCTLVSEESKYYVKVTEAPADWTGKYLIVYGNNVLSGISSNIGQYASVDVLENVKIVSNSTVDAYACEIIKTSEGYYIKLASSYLYASDANKLHSNASLGTGDALNNYIWTIAKGDTGWDINNKGQSSRYLQWNNNSGQFRFACYKDTQKEVDLYRLEE